MALMMSNLSDRLLDANKRVNQEIRKSTDIQQDAEEDAMGYAYENRKPKEFLNENKGVFYNKDAEKALNTAKSVFDRTAVFHVEQE